MDQFDYSRKSELTLKGFMAKTFGWMFWGLLLFFASGFIVAIVPTLRNLVLGNPFVPIILFIIEIIIVVNLSARLMKMSVESAKTSFMAYSVVSGLTFSSVFIFFELDTVMYTFLVTAVMFGVMAIAGSKTSVDLSKISSLLFFGLIGVLIVSLVNIFLNSDTLTLAVSIIAILVFLGLTAWDVQRLKKMYYGFSNDGELTHKIAIYGALQLFLDFINIFYYILRIFARSRD